jgi:hypothetical protein
MARGHLKEQPQQPYPDSPLLQTTNNNINTSTTLLMPQSEQIILSQVKDSMQTNPAEEEEEERKNTSKPSSKLRGIPFLRRSRLFSADQDVTIHKEESTSNSTTVSITRGARRRHLNSLCLDETEETPIVAPMLPLPPYPVDQYHFYCTSTTSTTKMVKQVHKLMKACDIEYKFTLSKCKFKCIKYMNYNHVEFIIRMYISRGTLLIEFQRRTGSILLWDGLYSIMYHKLYRFIDHNAFACSQSGRGQKKVLQGLNSMSSIHGTFTTTTTNSSSSNSQWQQGQTATSTGIDAMQIMITSKFIDAKREGCAGLAVLTEDKESCFLVAQKKNILPQLVLASGSSDFNMARCAIGAMTNIANAVSCFSSKQIAQETCHYIEATIPKVIALLEKNISFSQNLEFQRECVRAIDQFAILCPEKVIQCNGISQLQLRVKSCDKILASICTKALQSLQLKEE